MEALTSSSTIETTIGDLVEAVTQVAIQATKTQEEAYKLASLAVSDMLRNNPRGVAKILDEE